MPEKTRTERQEWQMPSRFLGQKYLSPISRTQFCFFSPRKNWNFTFFLRLSVWLCQTFAIKIHDPLSTTKKENSHQSMFYELDETHSFYSIFMLCLSGLPVEYIKTGVKCNHLLMEQLRNLFSYIRFQRSKEKSQRSPYSFLSFLHRSLRNML